MLLLLILSHVSGTLTFFAFLVALVYIILIRRAMGRLMGDIADRHIEIRLDLKSARDARECQHKEILQALSMVPGELKQGTTLAQTTREAPKEPDIRKTVEKEPMALRQEADPAKEQPPPVRVANVQTSAAPEGDVAKSTGEHPSESDDETFAWSAAKSSRTLVGLGASASSPGALMSRMDAGGSKGDRHGL